MNLYEFEYDLSQRIIALYQNEKEEYDTDIYIYELFFTNRDDSYLELVAKRELVRKTLSALKTRHKQKPVYYYTNAAKYKIIGNKEDYTFIHGELNKLRSLENDRVQLIENIIASGELSNSLINRYKKAKLKNKLNQLKNKMITMESNQRVIILNHVRQIGIKNYGLSDYENYQTTPEVDLGYQKPLSKPIPQKESLKNKLIKFKKAVIVGYNEFKTVVHSNDQVYTKKK